MTQVNIEFDSTMNRSYLLIRVGIIQVHRALDSYI